MKRTNFQRAVTSVFVLLLLAGCAATTSSQSLATAREGCTFLKAAVNADNATSKVNFQLASSKFKELAQAEKNKAFALQFETISKNLEISARADTWQEITSVAYWFCGDEFNPGTRARSDGVPSDSLTLEEYSGLKPEIDSTGLIYTDDSDWSGFWLAAGVIGIFSLYLFAIYWIGRTAKRAGRSFVGWLIIGAVFTPIAGIIVLTFRSEDKYRKDMKVCPSCAESIKSEANLCKFCKTSLI